MSTSLGERRASILSCVYELSAKGLSVEAACEKLQSVRPSTFYCWAKKVQGQPRERWPELLQDKKMNANNSACQKIWRSMRMHRSFTCDDIVMTSESSPGNVRTYVATLAKHGYLLCVGSSKTIHGRFKPVWRLIRNTGPKAPRRLQDGKIVWDPNLKQSLKPNNEHRSDS